MTKDPQLFTLHELKELLKQKGLSTKGSKNELISRLFNDDPRGLWLEEASGKNERSEMNLQPFTSEMYRNDGEDEAQRMLDRRGGDDGRSDDAGEGKMSALQREVELYRREKEAERELVLARCEIEFLRLSRNNQASNASNELSEERQAVAVSGHMANRGEVSRN